MSLDEALQQQRDHLLAALSGARPIDDVLAEIHPSDLAGILREYCDHEDQHALLFELFGLLPLDGQAQVLGYLPGDAQRVLVAMLDDHQLQAVVEEMESDERADLFNLLDEDRQQVLFRRMARRDREDIRRLASYEARATGAIMTTDYVAIAGDITVAQAMIQIRHTAPDAETVYQTYVVDQLGHLIGTLSLRQLIVAPPGARIASLMISDVLSIAAGQPREEAARMIAHYDLLALPVVDAQSRLIGIVTYDDAMDVVESEATEDIHKGMSIGQIEDGVGRAPLWLLYRKRVTWLVLLVFANIFSGAGIAFFEDIITAQVALVFFLPLLIGSGGNAGAQASTLMVRGMATGDIGLRDWGKLLGRELLVAGSLGLTMALAVAPIGAWRGGEGVAMIVALSMVTIVLFGSLLGMCLPFVLDRLGWDPATASAPLVTTLIDASGVLIYFTIATMLLHHV